VRGRVFRRGAGWSYVVDLSPDPATGKRRQRLKGGFHTKREAEAALAQMVIDVGTGRTVASGSEKLSDWLEEWLISVGPSLRPTTLNLYQMTVRVWITPRIGALRLAQVTPSVLQTLYIELGESGRKGSSEGLGSRSVRLAHQVLRQSLEKAVAWGLIRNNPAAASLELPRLETKPMRTWTVSEARRFLAVTSLDRFGPLWLLMLSTGLRRGEALGLRWEDVDFRASRLAVVQTVVVASNRVNLSEPKTAHSRRVVRLQSETVTALRRHQLRQIEDRQLVGSEWNELDLIFTTATGGPLRPLNIVRAFNQAVERADVPRIRIHDLRHTAATFALRQGVHPKLVQEMLGHANVAITLDLYSHVTDDMHQDAAKRIGRALFGASDSVESITS
jgi:integrase